MKRAITVRTPNIYIIAVIKTSGRLVRDEVEQIRDQLADRLQEAAAGLIYLKTPRNRVQVR